MAASYLIGKHVLLALFLSIGEFNRAFSLHFYNLIDGLSTCESDYETKVLLHNSIRYHILVKKYVCSPRENIIAIDLQ